MLSFFVSVYIIQRFLLCTFHFVLKIQTVGLTEEAPTS